MLKVVGASWLQTVASFLIVVGILLFGILIIIISRTQNFDDDGKYAATVTWNPESERYDIKLLGQNNDPRDVKPGIARAYYQPDMQKTGWAVLEIESNAQYSDEEQAYASGILEGSLSWQHIYWQWKNTVEHVCAEKNEFCSELRIFLKQNTETIRKKAKANDKSDPFWHQINLFYTQLQGIEYGWKYEARRNKQNVDIPSLDFLWLNIASDLKDFQKLALSSNNSYHQRFPASMSLLKLVSTEKVKFLLAHASSGFYSSMLRIQKKYSFNYHLTGKSKSDLVPGRIVSFTSYPGSIHSQDDFYQIQMNDDSKVTITGTALLTVDFKNERYEMNYQVLLGPRVMAGNRLSRNGRTWAYNVGKHNSGTGNKQWLHVHTSKNNVTLWVIEQTPQKVISKDETNLWHEQGYWISCGIPNYKESGDEVKIDSVEIAQYRVGDISLKNIMEVLRDGQRNVSNIQSLIDVMRGPELALVGRTDLHDSIVSRPMLYTSATSSAKQSDLKNIKPVKSSLRSDEKSVTRSSYVQEYATFSNSNSSIMQNFGLIYNSSWFNLFNLKNEVIMTSSPRKKHDLNLTQANVRHSKIFQRRKQDSKLLYGVSSSQSEDFSPLLTIDGVIDLKLTNCNDKFLAVAGPPFNLQNKVRTIEPFQWSKSSISFLPHNGHSDVWKYEPVEANFVWK